MSGEPRLRATLAKYSDMNEEEVRRLKAAIAKSLKGKMNDD